MTTELEKNVSLESCAQEGMLPGYALQADGKIGNGALTASRNAGRHATHRLELLDLLMWGLCFGMGTLFGSQLLPLIGSLLANPM